MIASCWIQSLHHITSALHGSGHKKEIIYGWNQIALVTSNILICQFLGLARENCIPYTKDVRSSHSHCLILSVTRYHPVLGPGSRDRLLQSADVNYFAQSQQDTLKGIRSCVMAQPLFKHFDGVKLLCD